MMMMIGDDDDDGDGDGDDDDDDETIYYLGSFMRVQGYFNIHCCTLSLHPFSF